MRFLSLLGIVLFQIELFSQVISDISVLNGTSFLNTPGEVWVHKLATGGNGTTASPWTGIETANLTNYNTQYEWAAGVFEISSTINLLGTNTYHRGRQGTLIKFTGTGVAVRFSAGSLWTSGCGFENFRIDCSGASRPTQTATSITMSGSGTGNAKATVTLSGHGYSTGDIIDIFGATQADYNGCRVITVTDANTFTYPMKGGSTAASPATGTITLRRSSVCLQLIGVRDGAFKNIVLANCSLGVNLQACVTYNFENLRCTKKEELGHVWAVTPIHGILIGKRAGSNNDATTCGVWNSTIIEHVSDYGVVIAESQQNVFACGTSEHNGGGVVSLGAQTTGTCNDNTFIGWDNEANIAGTATGQDFWIWGNRWSLINCLTGQTNTIAGGFQHLIQGGTYDAIRIDSAVTKAILNGVTISSDSKFVDNGNSTDYIGVNLTTGTDPANQASAWRIKPWNSGNIAAGGTLTVDASQSSSFQAVYQGNITLANPSNPLSGQRLTIRLTHSADSNSYGVTNLGSAWNLPASIVAPTNSNVSSGVSYIEAQYNSTSAKWDILSWRDITSTLPDALFRTITLANNVTLQTTNAAPAGFSVGVTAPVVWFAVTNAGNSYLIPGYAP